MRVLVVDDDEGVRSALQWLLEKEGHRVSLCSNGNEALAELQNRAVDVMFCDVVMPEMSGLELLPEALALQPEMTVVMISGQGDIATAVQAVKSGAYDFMEKPLTPDKVLLEMERIAERRRQDAEMKNLYDRLELENAMVGSSPAMQRLRATIRQIAPSVGRVLIVGESGSGKEPAAREIHRQSGRKGRFVQLNCAALPRELIESELFGYEKGAFTGATRRKIGLIEAAEGGTLLLDEVGDMTLETQAKLLRVLQENEFTPLGSTQPIRFDVRIIAATNKDLKKELERGTFRQDLFFRLNVILLQIPPLRERLEDIPELVEHFSQLYTAKSGKRPKRFTSEAVALMQSYHWPGNIRELGNLVERLSILVPGDTVDAADLKPFVGSTVSSTHESTLPSDLPLRLQVEAFERRLIQEAFQRCNGNVSRTAQLLQTDRANLHKKLKQYGIKP
ncbi:MAG: sigma-54 dependent transcriptional regulator [candidate division KSB1 bacterium]|nr:sigma-54 dependent transcriptional regulator [candidate division KSB1 bacterium]